MVENRLGVKRYPLKQYGFTASSQADSILQAVETEQPHPVKMLWIESANPIANMGPVHPHCCRAQNYRTVRAYEAATATEYTHSFRSERHVATYRPDIISDSIYCRCGFLALVKTRQ